MSTDEETKLTQILLVLKSPANIYEKDYLEEHFN